MFVLFGVTQYSPSFSLIHLTLYIHIHTTFYPFSQKIAYKGLSCAKGRSVTLLTAEMFPNVFYDEFYLSVDLSGVTGQNVSCIECCCCSGFRASLEVLLVGVNRYTSRKHVEARHFGQLALE